jgi:hypothetical protein
MALPIVIISGLAHALALMHQGFWSTRHAAGVFWSTGAAPRPGPAVLQVTRAGMLHLIRHGWECTHTAAQGWLCTPNQIR